MSKIVGIGANVCDTLYTIAEFPKEDTKTGAASAAMSGGGPCATALVAASKLGGDCAYIGNLTDDNAGLFLKSDLEKYNVSTELVTVEKGYTSFTSSIWLSKKSQSRTCVYHRGNIPELRLNEVQKSAIARAEILMLDGNELNAALSAAKIAKENGVKVLYDAGGLYDGVDKLMPYVDILIPSEEFALGYTGEKTAGAAVEALQKQYKPEMLVVTCGKEGGVFYDGQKVESYAAFSVDAVDTNGSGDVFHGAFAYAYSNGYDAFKACVFSGAVAALKCKKIGARAGAPDLNETLKFLKESGTDGF